MKEINRYTLLTGLIASDPSSGKHVLYEDHLLIVEQYQALIKSLESAERTLNHLGYKNLGGEMWKPPINALIDFNLVDQLKARIIELENQVDDYTNRAVDEAAMKCHLLQESIKKSKIMRACIEHDYANGINQIQANWLENTIKDCFNVSENSVSATPERIKQYIEQIRNSPYK